MNAAQEPRYELVIVSFLSREPLSRLLGSLSGIPTIIVDNAAHLDSVRDLAELHRHVRYVAARGNVGFAAAANLGASLSSHDVVIFVNPDCVPSPAVLEELAEQLWSDPTLASCSPALRDAQGRISGVGAGWVPTVRRCLVHAAGAHRLLRRSGIWGAPLPGETLEVGWLAGTCLAVRRSAFQEVGGFDERYFLYAEDLSLGQRFGRHHLRQVVRADLTVRHEGGSSSDVPSVPIWLMRAGSLGRFIDDRAARPAALIMRGVLAAGWVLRAVAMSLSPGRRLRRTEMLTYARGVMQPEGASRAAMATLGGPGFEPLVPK